jgi:N6-L-threonylcarbamoyladenine synthase
LLEKSPGIEKDEQKLRDLCASYQKCIVDALLLKCKYAMKQAKEIVGHDIPIVIGGGVACNSRLRADFKNAFENVFVVKPRFCTDNAGMIANYALRRFDDAIPFPESLSLDAKSRFISKGDMLKQRRQEKMKAKNEG